MFWCFPLDVLGMNERVDYASKVIEIRYRPRNLGRSSQLSLLLKMKAKTCIFGHRDLKGPRRTGESGTRDVKNYTGLVKIFKALAFTTPSPKKGCVRRRKFQKKKYAQESKFSEGCSRSWSLIRTFVHEVLLRMREFK